MQGAGAFCTSDAECWAHLTETIMPKKNRTNCFDFIEFPAKSIEDLNRTKIFYTNVFGWSYKDWGDDYSDTENSGLGSGIKASSPSRTK